MEKRLELVIVGMILAIGFISFIIVGIIGNVTGTGKVSYTYSDNVLLKNPPYGWNIPEGGSSPYGSVLVFTLIAIFIVGFFLMDSVKKLKY